MSEKGGRRTVKVFRYIEELDAFLPTEEYEELARYLGIAEWNVVVWIGRLFRLDNDVGEHWFDHWHLREEKLEEAAALGIDAHELLIVDPEWFRDFRGGADGPCHGAAMRKRFWTDVLRSLELSYEVLYAEARKRNARIRDLYPDGCLPDLEERIARVEAGVSRLR